MKSAAISRFVMAAAIAAMVVVGGSTAAWGQAPPCPASPNYPTDFSSELTATCLTHNNNAQIFAGATTVLRLTDASNPDPRNQTGSAWYNTPQSVQKGFTTSFQFQFTNQSYPPADGIAFVIQNAPSGLGAIGFSGGNGGAIGYGNDDNNTAQTGITNSLAVEFDTYKNGWDPDANGSASVSHVAIQSCGTGPNTSHHGQICSNSTNSSTITGAAPVVVPNLADGHLHTVSITYTPACPTCSPATLANIDVILDAVDIFGPVQTDLSAIGLTQPANTAYVGFTGSTGGDYETQDILNWTYMPGSKSGVISTDTPLTLAFQGGTQNNAYDYTAQLTAGSPVTGTINPILIDQKSCNQLVQKSFPLTQCFVYQNAGIVNGVSVDRSVLFELTCPDQPDGTCGDANAQDFFAELGSDFTFTSAENPGFKLLSSTIGPYPGWLKGTGPDPLHPCTPFPSNSPALFQSNQIDSFSFSGDPLGTTKGKSGGGGSCWTATYATTGELPPGVKITVPAFTTYHQNQAITASYTCSDPKTSQLPTNPTGPYLTAKTCTQSQAPNNNNGSICTNVTGAITCTGGVDTSVKGLHVFTVTSKDSGGNVGANAVIYNVVK